MVTGIRWQAWEGPGTFYSIDAKKALSDLKSMSASASYHELKLKKILILR